jgi:hypothetical protein
MIELRRRTERISLSLDPEGYRKGLRERISPGLEEPTSEPEYPIIFRQTFVLDQQGEFILPTSIYKAYSDEDAKKGRDYYCWGERWELPEDALAVEICLTVYGNLLRIIHLPDRITLDQIMGLEDLLRNYGMSLSERNIYEEALIIQQLVKAGHWDCQQPDENWPFFDLAEAEDGEG